MTNSTHKRIVKNDSSFKVLNFKEDLFASNKWDFADLGYSEEQIPSQCRSINFSAFVCSRTNEILKDLVWKKRNTVTASTMVSYMRTLRLFFQFSRAVHSDFTIKDIERRHLVEFMDSIQHKSQATKCNYFAILNELTVTLQEMNHLPYSRRLFTKLDAPRAARNHTPKALSAHVQNQLIEALDSNRSHTDRAILTLLEVGARGLELLKLRLSDVSKGTDGWYLTRHNQKYDNEHTVPISDSLAAVLDIQAEEILSLITKQRLDEDNPYLFGRYCPSEHRIKHYTLRSLNQSLKLFSKENCLTDEKGRNFMLRSHLFRHTVGTNLINKGVSQHYVMKFLGHRSPTMTAIYAEIHDSTLRKEIQKARPEFVDIYGKIYKSSTIASDLTIKESAHSEGHIDAQWLRHHIAAQTLPNGLCALPVAQSCEHANACLECPSFRTDSTFLCQHREQLVRTRDLIALAKKKGYTRQIEVNQPVLSSLEKIVGALEHG